MNPFYLAKTRLWGARNVLRSGQWKSALVWSGIVLGVVHGLYALFLHILTKVDQVNPPLIGSFIDLGGMLNRHILVMFLFSLFGMLVFSNIVTSLGTMYTSSELPLILAAPTPYRVIFFSKFLETCFMSSWMVLLITAPYLWAYGVLYKARPLFFVIFWVPLIPFFVLCTSLALLVTFFIARIFPVGRTQSLLRFFMVFVGALLLLMFRVMRPEQLIDPDQITLLLQLMEGAWNPRLQYSPAGWTGRALFHCLGRPGELWQIDPILIFGVPLFVLMITYLLARRYHISTWQAYQEASSAPVQAAEDIQSFLRHPDRSERVFGFLSPSSRAILVKDLKTYSRMPVLWTQLMLMLVIMFIYLYNIHLLPIGKLSLADRLLAEALSFLNVGFVSLITVALALRFGFPAVSMEGRGFFMIHSSPTGLPGYIRIKFWSNFIPLLLISEVLAAVSSLLLKSSILLLSVAVVDTFFLTMVIAAMSLYFGIIYVNFSAESFTRIPSGFGGMVFMIASMIFAGAILLLQSHAFWLYFRDGVGWGLSVAAISWKHYVYLATMIGLSGTICLKSTGAFLSAATARISYLEEGPQVDQS